MAQQITDYHAFFAAAKEAVSEFDTIKLTVKNLEDKEEKLEQAIKDQEKETARIIDQTIRQRADEISRSYDSQLDTMEERIKKVRTKREKAKNQGVKERIAEETAKLIEENRDLNVQMRTLFKTNHVPGICRSNYYYALYMTRGIKETGVLFLSMCVCFLLVPCSLYFLIPDHQTIHLIGIYAADILLFGGLYVAVGNATKHKYLDVIKEGRNIKNQIAANRKKIAAVTRAVQKDKNDSVYNLQKFDDEMAQLEQDVAEVEKKKKEALTTFHTVTKTIISDEIMGARRPAIEKFQAELEAVYGNLKNAQTDFKEKSLALTDTYEIYVGKEFLTVDRLSALSELIDSGQAANITEAITQYKSKEYAANGTGSV